MIIRHSICVLHQHTLSSSISLPNTLMLREIKENDEAVVASMASSDNLHI